MLIRLRSVELFQDIRANKEKDLCKLFLNEIAGQEYRGRMCRADLYLDTKEETLYIKEYLTGQIHILTSNNLKDSLPFNPDELQFIFQQPVEANVEESSKPAEVTPLIIRKRGRQPKVSTDVSSESL